MNLTLDPWQKEFLETEGDKILCTGRQVGKSEICGMDAGEWAVNNGKKIVLMIAPTERQAFALFNKTLTYISSRHRGVLKKGKDRPTKSKINLKNGTTIYCLPTGISGIGIRFLTVHRLYADEASRIPEEVFTAVTPMLLTTGGDTIYLSTPAGKSNTFSEIVTNKDNAYDSFTRFHTNSEKVMRERKICATWTEFQREKALEQLAREKSRMTKLQYAQEYEGELVDELMQFFPTDLIKEICTIQRGEPKVPPNLSNPAADTFLGVDIARMGSDDTVLTSLKRKRGILTQIDIEVTNKTYLTETVRLILKKDKEFNYKTIYIDDGGMGVGVFDPLLEHQQTKRKVIAINNASRSLDTEGRGKRLLKEDLYNNLLHLMENKKITLFEDPEIVQSLKSIQVEHTDGRMKIFGNYSHICESIIRAAWCVKDKRLNIWIM